MIKHDTDLEWIMKRKKERTNERKGSDEDTTYMNEYAGRRNQSQLEKESSKADLNDRV